MTYIEILSKSRGHLVVVKNRLKELDYDTNAALRNTVDILEVEARPYLHMQHVGVEFEIEHLAKKGRELYIGPKTGDLILKLRQDGLSYRAIAHEIGVSKSLVERFIKKNLLGDKHCNSDAYSKRIAELMTHFLLFIPRF